MLVINKKRIKFITLILIFSISIYLIDGMTIKEKETVEVTSTPTSNKVIIVDAGHGTPDEGAESKNGTTEAEINLKIALKLQNLLEQNGSTVLLTRSDSNAIYDLDSKTLKQKKVSDIRNRVEIANENHADLFVSIHLNKISQSQYYGWQCFYNTKNENSKILAESMQESLNDTIQKENNRKAMKLDTVYIMKKVEIPISIVECGFLSNPEEEQELLSNEYQERLAWGIYIGINNYFITINT